MNPILKKKIVNGKTLITMQPLKLSKRQLQLLNTLNNNDQIAYLKTFIGMQIPFRFSQRRDAKIISDKIFHRRRDTIYSMQLDAKMTNTGHRPYNHELHRKNAQWVAVEIECYIPDYDVDDMRALVKENKILRCQVKGDGSLENTDNGYGIEFALMFNMNNGFQPLKDLCNLLRSVDAVVDSSCGLHVHIDQFGKTEQQVKDTATNFERCLTPLFKIVSPSRKNNYYCQPRQSWNDRYSAVNCTAYPEHGTLELRLHNGTTNFTKIKNWIELLVTINNADLIPRQIQNVTTLISKFDLPDELAVWVLGRAEKFAKTSLARKDNSFFDLDDENQDAA